MKLNFQAHLIRATFKSGTSWSVSQRIALGILIFKNERRQSDCCALVRVEMNQNTINYSVARRLKQTYYDVTTTVYSVSWASL